MMEPQRTSGSGGRRRLLMMAALMACGAAIVAIAVATGVLKLGKPGNSVPTTQEAAAQRCQTDVMKRLAAPDKAQLADVRTENGTLDLEGRDLFPVTLEEPLKGADTARISVLNVSGVVNAQNEIGSTIQDHFNCRAYFIDGTLAHSLVIFDEKH
jgi:hypothetical protein